MAVTCTPGVQIPSEIESKIGRLIQPLCMLPAVANQAVEITQDPDGSVEEFSAVVERDAKLATDILSLANSVMYSPGRPILCLNQAVLRLGFSVCRNLIFASGMTSLMSRLELQEEWIRESLSRHGFTTALLALKINRLLNAGFQGEEFTAGLIHDFGRTLAAVCFSTEFRQVDQLTFEEGSGNFSEDERRVWGTDHCELGAWFVAVNGLPDALVSAVRFHHTPEKAGAAGRLTALTAVSDHMANHLQRFGSAEGYQPDDCPFTAVLEQCGVARAGLRLRKSAVSLMEKTVAEVEELIGF